MCEGVRAARTSPELSLAMLASDPGRDRGVRALADRSLSHCDTQVLLSGFPDFQQTDGK